jgi:hypothetical protein
MILKISRVVYDKRTKAWIRKQVPARIVEFTNRLGRELFKTAQNFTPVKTGRLQSGWTMSPVSTAGAKLNIRNTVYYGGWVNWGTSRFHGRFFVERTVAEGPRLARVVMASMRRR